MSYLKPYTPKTPEEEYCDSLVDKIVAKYSHKYKFLSTKDTTAFCYLGSKEIYIPEIYRDWPSLRFVFDIMHEVGHLETNTLDMETYQQEYLATVWAIKACNKERINVSPLTIAAFQRYICEWRDKSPNKDKIPDSAIQLPLRGISHNISSDSLREVKSKKSALQRKCKPITECVDMIDYLDHTGVEYVDNRLKRGNLTIVGDEKTIGKIVEAICSTYRITGRYGSSLRAIKGRAGWWTKG